MDRLISLAEYKQELQNELQNANLSDCVLPSSFKELFTSYHSYNFEFYKYTVKVSSAQGDCYIPNQWVYIGALCSQYHSELMKYKSKLIDLGITGDQFRRCHPGRDDNDIPENERGSEYIKALAADYLEDYNEDDKELLVTFLYDYNSWGGGKNISRNDFTVSPVLSIAHSINASSALIGVIAEALAEYSNLRQILVGSKEWEMIMHPTSISSKLELIREKAAAKFVRYALHETMKVDSSLSTLMKSHHVYTTAKRLNVGKFCLGCDSSQLPARTDDYDSNIAWDYNAATYYLYLEFTQADVETKFAPEYNQAYKSKFEICKEGEYFVLYQIKQNAEYIQRIYYGCPGSGKSHQVKKFTEKIDSHYVFRTTFHPDTDYASFVGCYKPSMKGGKNFCQYKTLPELKTEADIINSTSGDKVSRIISFVTKYAEDLQYIVDTDSNIKSLQNLLNKNLSFANETYLAFIVDYVLKNQETRIVYEFCPQIFTNAYVKAWEDTSKPVYLIIEEINRGNCAQIFGDLFQLLDRDKATGKSEYPIKADKDLVAHIEKVLGAGHEGIKNGELCLPPNLIIYATMNTSDQSLFPMDSAFKRRWDWKYVPIEYGADKDSYNFTITIGDKVYRWVDFLAVVNDKIYNATNSEDKQMGNFFIKKSIDADTFVNKVMFYLWNEVCKEEYGTNRNFFRRKKYGKEVEFKFTDLFGDKPTILKDLKEFMISLGVEPIGKKSEEPAAE